MQASSQLNQGKCERVADIQIWRWKSHNGLASDRRHNKEAKPGHNVSVSANIFPVPCRAMSFSDNSPKKRRAQNRAAQKAFRERQKRTYRDLEIRNEELSISLGEALQEINRLRTLINSMSLERKTHTDGMSPLRRTPEPSVCSAKCASRVQSARGPAASSQCPNDKGKNRRSFEHLPNAPHVHIHTNACLFKSTRTTTGDQHSVEFSSASNEYVAAMKSAKRVCISAANSSPPSIPNHENLHPNGRARQELVPDSAPWLPMDTTLSADQMHASAGLRSLLSSSLRGKEPSIRNLMNCSLQQGYDYYNTESPNFASTPLIDEDTLGTPLTSPNPTRGIHQFCADAQQFQPYSTNANDFPGQFQTAFEASAADFSDFTIPSSFGLGELVWFEAPY